MPAFRDQGGPPRRTRHVRADSSDQEDDDDGSPDEVGFKEARLQKDADTADAEKDSIQAAISMADLGTTRRDRLTSRDIGRQQERIPMYRLNAMKKANQEGTEEQKLYLKHKSDVVSWNAFGANAPQEDEELPDINSGQSHRLKIAQQVEEERIRSGGNVDWAHLEDGPRRGRGGCIRGVARCVATRGGGGGFAVTGGRPSPSSPIKRTRPLDPAVEDREYGCTSRTRGRQPAKSKSPMPPAAFSTTPATQSRPVRFQKNWSAIKLQENPPATPLTLDQAIVAATSGPAAKSTATVACSPALLLQIAPKELETHRKRKQDEGPQAAVPTSPTKKSGGPHAVKGTKMPPTAQENVPIEPPQKRKLEQTAPFKTAATLNQLQETLPPKQGPPGKVAASKLLENPILDPCSLAHPQYAPATTAIRTKTKAAPPSAPKKDTENIRKVPVYELRVRGRAGSISELTDGLLTPEAIEPSPSTISCIDDIDGSALPRHAQQDAPKGPNVGLGLIGVGTGSNRSQVTESSLLDDDFEPINQQALSPKVIEPAMYRVISGVRYILASAVENPVVVAPAPRFEIKGRADKMGARQAQLSVPALEAKPLIGNHNLPGQQTGGAPNEPQHFALSADARHSFPPPRQAPTHSRRSTQEQISIGMSELTLDESNLFGDRNVFPHGSQGTGLPHLSPQLGESRWTTGPAASTVPALRTGQALSKACAPAPTPAPTPAPLAAPATTRAMPLALARTVAPAASRSNQNLSASKYAVQGAKVETFKSKTTITSK